MIEEFNDSYYNDEPIITDDEFDLLADNGLAITNFRNKVNHIQPCGSLNKIKDEESFLKWIKGGVLKVTPKLDGNSIELIYENGKLIQAITRGDGFCGNDVTNNIIHCNYPKCDNGSVKCEAIMKKSHQQDYDKNIRNVVAGLINKKEPDINELSKIDLVSFDSLTPYFVKVEKHTYDILKTYFDDLKSNYKYEIDGLVIALDAPYYPETNDLLPTNTIALKFNKGGLEAKIGRIEWQLGKHGRLTPVIILEKGIEIDGTTVNRISASNYGIVKVAGLGIGAIVRVIKSGDIIPHITEVIEPSNDIIIPCCPNCQGELEITNIHLICNNCKNDKLTYLKNFFTILDIDYISDKTIEKLYNDDYCSLTSIFCLTEKVIKEIDGFGEKTANHIVNSLKNAKLTEPQVIQAAMVEGIGEKQSQSLITHFGSLSNFINSLDSNYDYTVIAGIGDIMSDRINQNKNKFKETMNDVQKNGIEVISYKKKNSKLNVAMTGKWELGRKEIVDKLEVMGYSYHDSVKKDTNVLLVVSLEEMSDKIKKAQQKGVEIITYDDFFSEIVNQQKEN